MSFDSSAKQRERSRSFMATAKETDHIISLEALCSRLGSNLMDGMSSRRVKDILRLNGPNTVSRPSGKVKDRTTAKIQRNVKSAHQSEHWSDKQWHEVFISRLHQTFSVLRDGDSCFANGKELVVGDVIFLFQGQTVPVDARIVSATELLVDNRIITGITAERKSAQPTSADVLRSANMIFAGTQILSGECSAIVLKRGNDTVYATLIQFARKVELVRQNSFRRQRTSSCSSESNTSLASNDSPSSPKRTASRGVKGSLSRAFGRQRARSEIK